MPLRLQSREVTQSDIAEADCSSAAAAKTTAARIIIYK